MIRKTCWDSRSRRRSAARLVAAPALAQNEQFIPALVYRTGAYAPNGVPFANGIADYYKLVNERDGGINGVKIVYRGMRVRLRHRPRRRVLRAPQEQGPDRRRLRDPAVDRRHLRAHREDADRQDPDHLDGLRPLRVARRLGVPVELPAARHLLDRGRHHPAAHRQEGRRLRQAQGQEDRAGLSRLALRQGADRAAAEARADARLRDRCCCRSPIRASSRRRPGCRSARTGPTTCCCGAGA